MDSTMNLISQRIWRKDVLVVFSCILLMEGIFSWLFIRNSIITEGYIKIVSILIYGFMLTRYRELQKDERIYLFLFTLLMLRLVVESLIKYDTLFRQLTMFTVLFPVMYVIFTKYILRQFNTSLLPFVAKFYLFSYIAFMLLFGRGFSFSLDSVDMDDYGPFSGDSRIIHASHILMMIIPFLWYLHQYFVTGKSKLLLPVVLCIVVILVHQHRSVWSSTLLALLIYCFASVRNGLLRGGKVVQIIIGTAMVVGVSYFFLANLMPDFVNFLSERFSEILNPGKEGSTGNFRLEQWDTYYDLFVQRPVFGWTFEGFEMPNPLVDWWPPMTGQHFHEGYMEILFYEGLAGFLLKYSFLGYLAIKTFSRNLSASSIILMAFSLSGLVFSLNYVLPLIFWAMVGMCLFYIERDNSTNKESIS